MIEYKVGNLLDTPDKFILHGVNGQGVMGSGVAKAIRDKYPNVFKDYHSYVVSKGHDWDVLCGDVLACIQDDGKVILNGFTQRNYGKDGDKYVSYDAIDEVMARVGGFTKVPISMPKIGAGLGGGAWTVIASIIEYRMSHLDVTVWELP